MLKKLFFVCTFSLISFSLLAQETVITLWKTVPNQKETNEQEIVKIGNIKSISNVQVPSFEVFIAPKNISTKKAVLILPGGGYGNLAFDHEGTNFAKWLNTLGISAFVLKYRLPKSKSIIKPHLAPLQDVQRAIKLIRFNAEKWNIHKNKIGVLGFSAGGHLAATLGTHYDYKSYENQDNIDNLSAKPNFMALIYPVISMKDAITHQGSKFNLLGKNPSKEIVHFYSNELQVNNKVPPTFILHTTDDNIVPIENSLFFFQALKKNNVLTEMHIYPKGGHGFAFGKNNPHLKNWIALLDKWLKNQ
ncbi:alpha/beta hydrolase [Flavivirga eckloniae]|uniref:Esterase n=1 Tax=Flavivirga eckloniae TaxID=1803846 RepID=A0A2K9PUU7_9FLAO|nr:alpha/beta hydrolase [Flavivirga eckloniae]AUP80578.1 esterase [Flavivirga eckloniae]